MAADLAVKTDLRFKAESRGDQLRKETQEMVKGITRVNKQIQ